MYTLGIWDHSRVEGTVANIYHGSNIVGKLLRAPFPLGGFVYEARGVDDVRRYVGNSESAALDALEAHDRGL